MKKTSLLLLLLLSALALQSVRADYQPNTSAPPARIQQGQTLDIRQQAGPTLYAARRKSEKQRVLDQISVEIHAGRRAAHPLPLFDGQDLARRLTAVAFQNPDDPPGHDEEWGSFRCVQCFCRITNHNLICWGDPFWMSCYSHLGTACRWEEM